MEERELEFTQKNPYDARSTQIPHDAESTQFPHDEEEQLQQLQEKIHQHLQGHVMMPPAQ